MLFSSTVFLFVFLPLALAGNALLRSQRSRNVFLLGMSLLFYAWGEPVYVFLMIGSIVFNYLLGLGMGRCEKTGRKALLVSAVAGNLGVLFVFKYLNFTLENLHLLFSSAYTPVQITMPIGISFFTFQAMSYVIDVYRGTADVQKNPLYLGLYISFFPQLIAGPIVRYNSIEEQILHRRTSLELLQGGVFRFVQGLAKKIILANNLSLIAERGSSLAAGGELSVAMAWLGALAYTFQIYFDFSGYSDMAIGLGKMFGFHFEENFNYPYLSRSVSEFWNRWHISLGRWFRDYVYFPLGGSRVGKGKLVRNLFVVWLLTGVWHGAAWQFIVWGLGYGVIISLEKLSGVPKRVKSPAFTAAYSVLTFLIVNFGWVLFGASSFEAALRQLAAMFGVGGVIAADAQAAFALSEGWPWLLLAAVFSTPYPALAIRKLTAGHEESLWLPLLRALALAAVMLICVSFLVMGSHNPFIYFTF